MRSSANFRAVFPESQNANPLDVEPETHFNAKWPVKVIQGHLCFGINDEALRGYIVQYRVAQKTEHFLGYHIFAATKDIIMRFSLKCSEITAENNK